MASQREPQNDLTKWLLHLALSPLDGPEAYSQALLQTAQAYRAKDGDPHISASLFASADMLPMLLTVSPPKASTCNLVCYWLIFRDAVALAQNRLPEGHPTSLICIWLMQGIYCMLSLLGSLQMVYAVLFFSINRFILGKDNGSAIDAIACAIRVTLC
ncbi:hypothetical protein DSO57_1036570 [Entomophthora muscae]|uniref:Uncharacterized protein n=1 Tax=Entomophthora muscae TaxID=34485 RepID=A0ACC2RQ87_9FUNG|nr:hypothetical protein DSO57_1036570 [Entomophthora muscae]